MKSFRWDKKYLFWGVTAFCVIACSIGFFMLLQYIPIVSEAIKTLFGILSPFIWGLVITYLLLPTMRMLEKHIFSPMSARLFKNNKKGKTGKRLSRGLSVLFSEIFLLIILAALIYLILPQLYSSLSTIVQNSNAYYNTATEWLQTRFADYPEIEAFVLDKVGDMGENVVQWLSDKVLPSLGNVVTDVAGGVVVFIKGVYNLIIGIIASMYILGNLETFTAFTKRLLYCLFTVEKADKLRDMLDFTNRTFMNYITGTLLDAAIIGGLCYVFCLIVGMPYGLLISVINGVTNIIPFFGPFIGAIPSGLILLLINPFKCLIFVVFIIVLQQCDGNIIKPKILGNSVGINGFWVLFSIIVGAGLFGFWGMLLGVPVFVVIYALIEKLIRRRLSSNNLPVEGEEYKNIDRIDPRTREIIPIKYEEK